MKKNILLVEKKARRIERLQLVLVFMIGFVVMAAGTYA